MGIYFLLKAEKATLRLKRGRKAVYIHGIHYYTKCASICDIVEDHTDLFSCLWMTFGQPCWSPFLLVYIGADALPEDITREANPIAKTFEDIRLVIEFHPDQAEAISATGWFSKYIPLKNVAESREAMPIWLKKGI